MPAGDRVHERRRAARSRATTATRRGSRSPRSPGGSDGLRPPSRHTCMTRLRLTKDLRIALRAKSASAGARRALTRAHESPRASAGQNARRHGVTAPACARSRPALARTPGVPRPVRSHVAPPRDPRHRCCEIVRWGSAAPRAGGRLLVAARRAERTTRRSGAVTATRSTRLAQPWQRDSAEARGGVIQMSP